jgi:hypothetical protein
VSYFADLDDLPGLDDYDLAGLGILDEDSTQEFSDNDLTPFDRFNPSDPEWAAELEKWREAARAEWAKEGHYV